MLTFKEDQQSKGHHPDRSLPMVQTASIDKQRIAPARDTLLTQYQAMSRQTERLCQPLALEEMEWGAFAYRVTLGIHHEQQHQELLLTDIKHIFATNPLRPVYREPGVLSKLEQASLQWVEYTGGLSAIGHAGDDFAFDNE